MQLSRQRRFDPMRTAILVVDVQNATFNAAQESIRPEFFAAARDIVIPNLARLIAAGRRHGVEVIYTVIENLTRDGRDRSLDYKLSDFFIAKGSWEARVLDAIAPGDDRDYVILDETSSSVFNSTNIDYLLRNLGVEDLVVTGFLTDQCIDHTVKDAADRGLSTSPASPTPAWRHTWERHRGGARHVSPATAATMHDGGTGYALAGSSIAQRVALALLRFAQLRHHLHLGALVAEIGVEIDRAEPFASLPASPPARRAPRRAIAAAGGCRPPRARIRHRRNIFAARESVSFPADAVDAGVHERAEREIGARRRVGRAELDVELARRIGAGQIEHRADPADTPRGRGRRRRPRSAPSGSAAAGSRRSGTARSRRRSRADAASTPAMKWPPPASGRRRRPDRASPAGPPRPES